MKKSLKRIALFTALLLLASLVLGCKMPDGEVTSTEPIAVETDDASAIQTAEITPEPTPEFEVKELTSDAFDQLDLEVFCWYATMDGYTFHMFVTDPDSFGIDRTTVPMTLGEFTEEDSIRLEQEATVYLQRINAIDREELPEEKQFSYDVLQQVLEDLSMDTTDYEYMYEPLTEYTGLQCNLPLSFALFELENVQDVEDYLTLLADTPRYLGQVLTYEQKRAELGYFMTEDALDSILEDCQSIIDSRDDSFLYATFNNGIEQLTELNDEQKTAYEERNESLIKNEFIGAFETLYDGLEALRKYCRTYEEAAELNDTQKAYFEYCMQDDGCNQLSVEETLDLLKNELYDLLNEIVMLQYTNPDLLSMEIDLTSGDMETDLDQLKSIASALLPALPEHTLTLTDVPEELEDMFSPAAYVIPALDEWQKNTVYINLASDDPTLFLTLAHECYPGHLYQYVYQRNLDDIGLMQKAANFGGYAEGWAQFAEYLVSENQTQYESDYVRYVFAYGIFANTVLPAVISILVNYYGYSEDALATYLTGIGLQGDYVASVYYDIVIDQPYYFFEYAIGYSEMIKLYNDAKDDLGDDFDQEAFLTAYLNLGPGYFNLIDEQMDVWVDSQMNEQA